MAGRGSIERRPQSRCRGGDPGGRASVRGGDRRCAGPVVRLLPADLGRSPGAGRMSARVTKKPRGGGERGRADMHLHTLYSDGTMEVQALLDQVERETDLDLIAVTDHERIDGALRARELHDAGDYHFGLVVGEEITTRRGHLLGLFLTERIP